MQTQTIKHSLGVPYRMTASEKSRRLDTQKLSCLIQKGLIDVLLDTSKINPNSIFGVPVNAKHPAKPGENDVVSGVRSALLNAYMVDWAEHLIKLGLDIEGIPAPKSAKRHKLAECYARLCDSDLGNMMEQLWSAYCDELGQVFSFPIRLDKNESLSLREIMLGDPILKKYCEVHGETSDNSSPSLTKMPLIEFLKFVDLQELHSYHYHHEKIGRRHLFHLSPNLCQFWQSVMAYIINGSNSLGD